MWLRPAGTTPPMLCICKMKQITRNQTFNIVLAMYGINIVLYTAILYVFVEGVCEEGLLESAIDTWSHPEGREIMEIIFVALAINMVMCLFTFLCRVRGAAMLMAFTIVSWVLVLIVSFGGFDYSLWGNYLIASFCLSAYLYSSSKGARHA